MNRKQMTAVLTLSGCAVAALITYFKGYSLKDMLIAIAAAFVFFYMLGSIIKMVLDSFDKANKKNEKVDDEGEVIEKEGSTEEVSEANSNTP